MTYLQEIEEIIKTHPEIPQAVIGDVIYRVRNYLEMEHSGESDACILNNLNYLKRWI